MFSIKQSGSFDKTTRFLQQMSNFNNIVLAELRASGQKGVNALASATPYSSGIAAHSWGYEVESNESGCSITWTNSDIEHGFPVAIMLQYGYATGTGGYVQGRDYINPAIRPIFDEIADRVWKVVTSA